MTRLRRHEALTLGLVAYPLYRPPRISAGRAQLASWTVQTITVVVVHPSPPIRDGLAELLHRQSDVRVVGTYSTLAALREGAASASVVLCDLAAARAEIAAAAAMPRLLVFNVADEDRTIIDCVQVGASGCVLQDADLDEMVAGIRAVAAGVVPCSARVVTSLFRYIASHRDEQHPVLAAALTGREEQVLRLVAAGLSNRQIADQLSLRPQTVKNHVRRVFEKLDVHSRLELISSVRPRADSVPVPQ